MRSLTAAEPSKAKADSSAGPNDLTDLWRAMRSVVGSSTSGADIASARSIAALYRSHPILVSTDRPGHAAAW